MALKKTSISFCIPTYNRLSLLTEAVESVLKQDELDNFSYEILISDDSSNEETAKWVGEKAKENTQIKYLRNPNSGQFNNLNNLITNARYEWIVFLHDDDHLSTDYLSNVFKKEIIEDTNVGIVWSARKIIGCDGEEITQTKSRKSFQKFEIVECREFFYSMLANNDYFFGGLTIPPLVTGLAAKKEIVMRAGFFDQRFEVNADSLFLWKLFFVGEKAAYINSLLMEYRIGEDSERCKPSARGIVYSEMKGIIHALLDFLQKELPQKKYLAASKIFFDTFYMNSLIVNGPVLWIALRYSGLYHRRIMIQLRICEDVIKNAPILIVQPKTWIVIFISFLPQFLLRGLYRIWLRLL